MRLKKILLGMALLGSLGFATNASLAINTHIPGGWSNYGSKCEELYNNCLDNCQEKYGSGPLSNVNMNSCERKCSAMQINCEKNGENRLSCAKEYQDCIKYSGDDKDLIEDCRQQYRECRKHWNK